MSSSAMPAAMKAPCRLDRLATRARARRSGPAAGRRGRGVVVEPPCQPVGFRPSAPKRPPTNPSSIAANSPRRRIRGARGDRRDPAARAPRGEIASQAAACPGGTTRTPPPGRPAGPARWLPSGRQGANRRSRSGSAALAGGHDLVHRPVSLAARAPRPRSTWPVPSPPRAHSRPAHLDPGVKMATAIRPPRTPARHEPCPRRRTEGRDTLPPPPAGAAAAGRPRPAPCRAGDDPVPVQHCRRAVGEAGGHERPVRAPDHERADHGGFTPAAATVPGGDERPHRDRSPPVRTAVTSATRAPRQA